MNNCVFIGKLTHKPKLSAEDSVNLCTFELEVEDYRKDKNKNKKTMRDILYFEIWDTGAEAFVQNSKEGDLISVECVARTDEEGYTYFRVKSFKNLG